MRLLLRFGGILPPLFDEQVRHLGLPVRPLGSLSDAQAGIRQRAFQRGANALLVGEQLLCAGVTSHRAVLNAELYEKCARAYVIAAASGNRIRCIPFWVRWIAAGRLRREERRATGR
jgi:hypothetical protein